MKGKYLLGNDNTTEENLGYNDETLSTTYSENKALTNKEKKKLEYEERMRKKRERQLKRVKKIITKSNLTSLNVLKNELLIDIPNTILNGAVEPTNTLLKGKNDQNANSKNVNTSIIKKVNDNLNEPEKQEDERNRLIKTEIEKKNGKYKKLCFMENISKKKLMKKLKYKQKQDKEAEKEKLLKSIEQYRLNNNERNFIIQFNTNNKNQNQEGLEKLFQTYKDMKIDLPNNLRIIKNKLQKKKKKFLECKKRNQAQATSRHDDVEKKPKVLKNEHHQMDENEHVLSHPVVEYGSNIKSLTNEGNYAEDLKDHNPENVLSSSSHLYINENPHKGAYNDEKYDYEIIDIVEADNSSHDNDRLDHVNRGGDENIKSKDIQEEGKNEEMRKSQSKKKQSEETKTDEEKRKIVYKNVSINRKDSIEKLRQALPVLGYEQEIIEAILNYDVVFISGDTGCGKSTQIPQFVYEHGFCTNDYLIGVTEPRKIAVKSISNRLNEELNINDVAGYQIRFEKSHFLKNSKIKVMTEGILLKEIMNDFILSKYSVIILDEAHERSINMDLILGLLSIICKIRKNNYFAYKSNMIPIKVIIMSATIDEINFFENQIFTNYTSINIPTEKVPVVDHFLSYTPKYYIEEAKKKVIQIHKKLPPGSILVFLTSQEEIYHLYNMLNNLKMSKENAEENIQTLDLTNEEKKKIQDENIYSFDLSEDEKKVNEDKCSFFLRSTDENKEKRIIFEVSDEDDDDDDIPIHNNSLASKTEQRKNDIDRKIENSRILSNPNNRQADQTDNKIETNNLEKTKNSNDDFIHEESQTKIFIAGEEGLSSTGYISEDDNYRENSHNDDAQVMDNKSDNEQSENCESNEDDNEVKEIKHHQNEHSTEQNKEKNPNDVEINNKKKCKKESSIWKGSDGSGKLKIFKLFANLPMHEQMRLFKNPKDNERICILSTNIAETSITLPNIRYVVDCGKEKRKMYSTLNDYSYYIIDNISKSSSLQRKGRAGRILHLLKKNKKNKKKIETEKGHVYKLYSSNYYNYFFKKHNDFPILNYPLDSLILYLLSFKIKNVENFPFINKPEKCKFEEAKKRLIYLNCVHFGYKDIEFLFKDLGDKMASKKSIENHINMFNPQKKSGITLAGSFILSLPISTRYAKILTDVCLKSLAINHTSSIPLACLLVSCLYLESIFSYDYKLKVKYGKRGKKKKRNLNENNTCNNSQMNGKNDIHRSNSNLVNLIFKKNAEHEVQTDRDSSSSSDLSSDDTYLDEETLSEDGYSNNKTSDNLLDNFKLKFDNDIDFYLNICISFYFSKEKNHFCSIMQLDQKKMEELIKLSNHLMKIINYKFNKNINFDFLDKNPSDLSKKIIHYAVIQGFIDHLAIRSDLIHNNYTRNSNLSSNKKNAYFSQNMNTPIYINSTSLLYKNRFVYITY